MTLLGDPGVRMHISHYGHVPATTLSPKGPEVFPVEPNDSALQSARIEVVVENEFLDPRRSVRVTTSKEERPAFSRAPATRAESSD
jgi:hypothetical protein